MTDVPWAPAKRLSSPQMTSAATRPCLFAGPASEMSASSPVTRWLTWHGVAHGVDVLDAGLHAVVHDDAALDARLKPRRIRKGRIGRDADGEHHHVGAQRLFAGQEHVDAAIALLEALHGAPQRQTHPVGAHLLVDEGGPCRRRRGS